MRQLYPSEGGLFGMANPAFDSVWRLWSRSLYTMYTAVSGLYITRIYIYIYDSPEVPSYGDGKGELVHN